jgi:hypothetical protein
MERDAKGQARPVPPLWPFLLLCLGAALWIDFGPFHRQEHADALVPVLTSLYHWTFYYWQCNRIGQLLPLLAVPVQHPLANLFVQAALGLFAGLAGFFLLARYVFRDHSWPLVATASACAFLCLTPRGYSFNYLVGYQPYALGTALGLGALVLTMSDRRAGRVPRLAAAVLLSLLAHWVFIGACLALGPVVVMRYLCYPCTPAAAEGLAGPQDRPARRGLPALLRRPSEREAITALGVLGVGWAFMMLVMALAPNPETDLGGLKWQELPRMLAAMLASLRQDLHPYGRHWMILLGAATAFGLGLLLTRRTRHAAAPALRAAAALGVAALAYALFVATRKWVAANGAQARYWWPAVFLVLSGTVGLLVAPACAAFGRRRLRALYWACAPALLLVAFGLYGLPSAAKVRADLDRFCGARSADIIATGTTHLWGSYWDVWPAVFHANMVLRESGSDRRVHGLAFRSWATLADWNRGPRSERRLARALPLPGQLGPPEDHFGLVGLLGCPIRQLRLIEKRPFLDVYRADDRIVFDARTDLLHLAGHAQPDGWAAEPGRDKPGFLTHGPYIALPPGPYLACFRLRARDLPPHDLPLLRLDICNARAALLLELRDLTRRDFRQEGRYHNFYVPFTLPGWNNGVEFRTAWHGGGYVQQEGVIVVPAGAGPIVFEPQDMEHQVGKAEGDAWAAEPGAGRKGGTLSSSPALPLPAGAYTAMFRMMARGAASDSPVATVEAVDVPTGKTLARKPLFGRDFKAPGASEEIALPFTAGSDHKLSFRVVWHGKEYLRHDRTTVVGSPKAEVTATSLAGSRP